MSTMKMAHWPGPPRGVNGGPGQTLQPAALAASYPERQQEQPPGRRQQRQDRHTEPAQPLTRAA